mmetsp:Transcript_9892/g.24663  ORF Transcript_9892/g.24663 Transcript_9892/m.24663 type:complete len:211 (+) Transcript_9892:764-1396(+)
MANKIITLAGCSYCFRNIGSAQFREPTTIALLEKLDVFALGFFLSQPVSQHKLPQGQLLEGRSGDLHFLRRLLLWGKVLSVPASVSAINYKMDELFHRIDDFWFDSFCQRLDVALSGGNVSGNVNNVVGTSATIVLQKSRHGIVFVVSGTKTLALFLSQRELQLPGFLFQTFHILFGVDLDNLSTLQFDLDCSGNAFVDVRFCLFVVLVF